MGIELELAKLQLASAEQTAAAQTLTQEVIDKIGAINAAFEEKKQEFDQYISSQSPIFNTIVAQSRYCGLKTHEAIRLEPGESCKLLRVNSQYLHVSGILTVHIGMGANSVYSAFITISGYGLTINDLSPPSELISLSTLRNSDGGGEHLSPGQVELILTAQSSNAAQASLQANFVNLSGLGVSVDSVILS